MNLISEINCIGICLKLSDLAPIIALLVVISITLLAARRMQKRPSHRIMTFVLSQATILFAILGTYYLMECSEMLTAYLYSGYVIFSTLLIFGILKFYDKILIRRLNARPISNIMRWSQEFVDRLTSSTVYFFDSAVPRAFAAGRSIFISIGLIEILDDDELKAVLAHEAWHIRNNIRTPFLKQLALMTFSHHQESELEDMADCFAEKIAGRKPLISARNKLEKVFI